MYRKETTLEQIPQAVWDVESTVRCVAGANLDTSSMPDGSKRVLKGTPLMFDKTTGEAKVVKTAKVVAAADAEATSLSVAKGSIFKVGDTIAGSKITAIDSSAEDKDVLTVEALSEAVAKDTVVDDGNGKSVVGMNYATAKMEDFIFFFKQKTAYEIQEDTLPYPLSDDIKTALTCRHHFAAY